MPEMLEEGRLLRVTMEVRLPKAASLDEAEAWLRFEMHDNGSLPSANPLLDCQPEPFGRSFEVEDTGKVGREERFDHWTDGARSGCKVRYVRDQAA